ncbi:MAG: TIGR01620 family protein [Pseudomonadota bacterium]
MSDQHLDKAKLTYYDPSAEFSETLTIEDDAPDAVEDSAVMTSTSKSPRFGRWLLLALLLLMLAVVIESVLLIQQSFAQHWLLGGLWSVGLGLAVCVLTVFIGRELLLLKKLKRRFQNQQQSTRPEQLLADLKHPDLANSWQQIVQPYWSEAEIEQRFELDILARVDQQAQRLVSKRAAEAAALVAVSPSSVADMLLLLWRSQRMITDIARCYGVQLGYWSRIRLWRQMLTNLAYAGLSEIAVDAGTQWLSAELMSKLSARAGQGMGAGLLTARLGFQVMQLTRPLPFKHVKKPGYARLQKDLLKQLSTVLPTLYKRRKQSTEV